MRSEPFALGWVADTSERDLRRLVDEHAALRRVAMLVAQEAPPDEVFSAVAEEARLLLDLPLVAMSRFEPDGTIAVVGSAGEHPFQSGTRWPVDGPSVSALVRRTGRPETVDYAGVAGTIGEQARAGGLRSGLGIPIVVHGEVWGVMATASVEGRPLPPDAASRLAGFTELVATAIANTQARDELARLVEEHAALRRVAVVVAEESSPVDVCTAVAREIVELLGLSRVSVHRYNPDGGTTQVGGYGENRPYPDGTRFPPAPGVASIVLDTGRAAQIDFEDVEGDIAATLRASGVREAIGVPVVVDGELWGLVIAVGTDEQPLPTDGAGRLESFTHLVATALSNAQARDDLRRIAAEQSALRAVATLVARGAAAEKVFATVAAEVAQLLGAPAISMLRFEPDGTSVAIAVYGDENPFGPGTRFEPWPGVMQQVRQTGRPARLEDYAHSTGPTTARLQAARIHSGVGVPITVDGEVWGTIIALAPGGGSLPEGIEPRLGRFTDLVATALSNAQARAEVRSLADEQAALRRVATLVAEGAEPEAVFDAVSEEAGPLLGAASVNLAQFTIDGYNLTRSGWSRHDTHVPTGTRLPIAPDTINWLIQTSAAPARMDSYEHASSELAALIRKRGIRSEVGAPVILGGRVWGALIAGLDTDELLPPDTERRIASFSELVATAVANAIGKRQLILSRARIVTAGDEARRRIERDLHDGTQQRLVSIGLDLELLRAQLPENQGEARASLDRLRGELEAVLEEVREVSRGLHPALLAQRGLQPSLRALARRSPVRVDLDVELAARPPERVEIATYYVVSEALTNAAKHAQATRVSVIVRASDTALQAEIEDDGIGGARSRGGTGLVGLIDRVEALGGRLTLDSPPGAGTRIEIELPLAPQGVLEGGHEARPRQRAS
jgi:signal transduction histidine kinase